MSSSTDQYKFKTPAKSLKEHVLELLRDGKTSKHDDFQVLFRVFGEERIRKMVETIREELKKEKS